MLIVALTYSDSGGAVHYIDNDTGAIILLMGDELIGENIDEDMASDDLEEYLMNRNLTTIEPIGSRQGYQILAEFVDTLPDGIIRIRLDDAIHGKGVFRRFKDRLYEYPEIQKQYYHLAELAHREIALRWLE